MLLKITVPVLLVALATPGLCQGPQVNSITGVPDDVLYRFFFQRVLWYDSQAGGIGPPAMRSVIQQQAGLTALEAATLTSIARDSKNADSGIFAALQSLAAADAPRGSVQAQGLAAQAQQNVLNHIGQLRAALGPACFYLLDLFVRRTVNITGPGVSPPSQ